MNPLGDESANIGPDSVNQGGLERARDGDKDKFGMSQMLIGHAGHDPEDPENYDDDDYDPEDENDEDIEFLQNPFRSKIQQIKTPQDDEELSIDEKLENVPSLMERRAG